MGQRRRRKVRKEPGSSCEVVLKAISSYNRRWLPSRVLGEWRHRRIGKRVEALSDSSRWTLTEARSPIDTPLN